MNVTHEHDRSKIRAEIQKRTWKAAHVLFWGSFSLLPLLAVLDFLLIPDFWFQLLLFKALLIPVLYGVYKIVQNLEVNPNVLLHVTLVLVNLHLLAVVFQPIEQFRFVYFIILITIFISFNSIAIWTVVDAVFQFVILMAILACGFYIGLLDDVEGFMREGGYLFIGASLVSTLYPQIRFLTLKDSIKLQLTLDSSYENYKVRSAELEARFKQLGELTDQKNEKLRIARHDIRNKIANIHSLVTLIQSPDAELSEKDKESYMHIISEVCEELLYLIEQLLQPFDMQSDNGELELHLAPVDFNKEIQDVLLSLNELVFSKNLQLEDYLSQASYVVTADKVYLSIVLRNLITYAIRLSNNNNTLILRSGVRNDKAYFEIVNKTNGIPSAQMESYFNKLKALKSSHLNQDYGQGLGLSIAKMLTEKMGGYISYATSPDLGYEFSVQFKINT